ncbi:hypothetical protein [Gemmatimonas sp.]|uniref:hypothetical protein n=1 Tax=Gemmatimonas sp. TaxID=1962908 RepID=UPI00398312BC
MIRHLAKRLLVLGALCCPPSLGAQTVPDQVTVPLLVERNRPYVIVTFQRPDGSVRTARFLLDTGGGGFLLTEPLARELGLTLGPVSREEGQSFARVTSPLAAWIGTLPLTLNPQRVSVLIGRDNVLPTAAAGHAEGMVPGHVLARYHVVFDYPGATLTLAAPGVLTPRGTPLPMPVSKGQGFPRTEIEVDGRRYGMLLDTGASFTMVSEVVLKAWGKDHPEWPRYPGAFGDAATLGGMTLETMFVPAGSWGAFPLRDVGVTSQREGTFERYMSGMMRGPIVGSLAGNILTGFRVELDYAHEMLYLSAR